MAKRYSGEKLALWMVLACLAGILSATALRAGPFAEKIPFTQPDGTAIEIWGQGDEFYAVFETLDGFSVMFDQKLKAYCFASLSPDGNDLVSTAVQAHKGTGQALGLAKHVRIHPDARRKKVKTKREQWEKDMDIPRRWTELKAITQQEATLSAQSDTAYSPPSRTTVGTRVGLVLLIDFDDDVATIPQSNVVAYCNGDNYTGYSNNGSVKKYFYDNSNGRLTYSNVVTIYIRIPNSLHPKSYYNDTTKDCGTQAQLMIRDAVAIMKALPNYTTEIVPTFEALSVDSNNNLLAANVYYAGGNGGVWTYGLWPHSSSMSALELSPGGKRISRYQVSNIGSSLSLGTFCHENGHMLCGFPDIYDYDYDSTGGAGRFCIMNSGGSGSNPCQVCAYLKRAAGWATTIDLSSASRMTASLSASGSNFNVFYRYPRPGVSTEYFILENRQKSGRDSGIPAAGIAIWHIDERGDKDNQNLTNNTIHANYEVTLVQADNQWHFQRDVNSGDASDLYYLGNSSGQYNNQFTDQTSPNAHWWDGTNSGAHFGNFSASANTMTFTVGEGEVYVALEAEVAALTAPMAKYSDPLASRGQYISSYQAGAGSGALVFNVPVTNRYVIWARVLAADASQNSSFVSVDNVEDEFDAAEGTLTNVWQWVRVNGRGGTGVPLTLNPRYFDLRAGAHSFVFRGDEAGAKLDRIIVTSDLNFTPNDTPPSITAQPRSLTVLAGADAAFKVQASGLPALSYRWLSNGVPLSAGTNADYTIVRAQTNYTAGYSLVVSNLFGAVTSQVAMLTVLEAPSGWVAFNDHFAGPGTHPNSSAWNVFGTEGDAPGNSGQLKDIITGAMLPVTLTITNAYATGGTSSGAPSPGTPAYETFNRFVDFGSGTLNHAVMVGSDSVVAHVFSGLNPGKRYSVKATSARGGSGGTAPDYYSNRWTRVELAGVLSYTSAHTAGVLTPAQVSDLSPAQAAFNSGINTNGAMVVWENIAPNSNGIFTVYSTRYTNTVPGGSTGGAQGYGYALVAVRLEEVGSNTAPYVILQPQSVIANEWSAVNFSVTAAGNPATYQWQKDNMPLANATNATLRLALITTNDAGAYAVVVGNSFGSVTSQVATLTVNPAPRVAWMAFNDHAAGAGTHANATRWNVFGTTGGAPGNSGRLLNVLTGTNLPVTLTILYSGATAGGVSGAAASNSPAYNTFNGYVDFQGTPNPSVEIASTAVVTYRFTGLNPLREYNFAGTAIRGTNIYGNRWAIFELVGAVSWTNAHTAHAYTNGLMASQVAICTGANHTADTGDMAVWQHIRPGADGLIEVTSKQYTGLVPGGTNANGAKGYAMTAMKLEELPVDPVVIASQPQDLTAMVGDTVSFAVEATGSAPLRYQWRFNGTNILRATNEMLTLTNVQKLQSGNYDVVVTNSVNAVTSAVAALVIVSPPVITTQPQSQIMVAGETVSFEVTATGEPPLLYQWRLNGVDLSDSDRISGATNSMLVISGTVRRDAGEYTVLVSTPGAGVVSAPARLTVAPAKFYPLARNSNGQWQVTWRGESGLRLELQSSTNLVDWSTMAVLTNTLGGMLYIDEAATNSAQRFYRFYLP